MSAANFDQLDEKELSSAATASDEELNDEEKANQRTQYIASIDEKFQRDVAALLFGFFDSIRYYSKLAFIVIFVTALAHGCFVVLLALKLDGNSIFNWNVTLMPLAIYYGLWFIISVVGFASLPIFTLTADQYANDIKNAINLSWIVPALDRRLQLERARLTVELRKAIANMLPVQHIARWLNAYVETNLVGNDAVLAQTLAAVERGDRLLQLRLAKQRELAKVLENLANAGLDHVVGVRPDVTTATDDDADSTSVADQKDKSPASKPPVATPQPQSEPLVPLVPPVSAEPEQEVDETPPIRAPRPMSASAAARAESLRSTAPPPIVVGTDDTVPIKQPPLLQSDPPKMSERLKLPTLGRATAASGAPEAPTPRTSILDAVIRLTDTLSSRLHDVMVVEKAGVEASLAASQQAIVTDAADDDDNDTLRDDNTDAAVPKVTDAAVVARHLLRAVRREVRRRTKSTAAAAAAAAAADNEEPNLSSTASLRASQLLTKVMSDLSASDAEPDAAALPSLRELAETLTGIDEKTLENVSKTLNVYVNDKTKQAQVAVDALAADAGALIDLEGASISNVLTAPNARQRRRRATTRSMGNFLRSVLVGGAREMFGVEPTAAGVSEMVGETKVSIGEALKTARQVASETVTNAAQAVGSALPPDGVLDAFVSRGTSRDTKEKADIRRTAVKAMGKQVLAECAPELVALVADMNNALTGASNTLQAITRVLRSMHETALFMAQMSHDVASASTPVEAVDRLGRWIHHQAMSQPAPDSLSLSVEERATQRRLLVREKTLEQMSQQRTEDDDDDGTTDGYHLRATIQAPVPIRESASPPNGQATPLGSSPPPARRSPAPPARKPRRRAVSPLVFANEPKLDEIDDSSVADDDPDRHQPTDKRRSHRASKRQHLK